MVFDIDNEGNAGEMHVNFETPLCQLVTLDGFCFAFRVTPGFNEFDRLGEPGTIGYGRWCMSLTKTAGSTETN